MIYFDPKNGAYLDYQRGNLGYYIGWVDPETADFYGFVGSRMETENDALVCDALRPVSAGSTVKGFYFETVSDVKNALSTANRVLLQKGRP